ncbi:MAG TPA: hypothetical protein VGE93_20065, partial [Bryobacteraceae bacterium]
DDIDSAMVELEARRALDAEFNKGRSDRSLQTLQEQLRGKQTLLRYANETLEEQARLALTWEFNPDHVEAPNEGPRISPEERARRDAYRNRMGAQVDRR